MSYLSKTRLGKKNALDDLVMIEKVAEDKILEALKNRYAADQIYTNIGPVLIAINPFKAITNLYTDDMVKEYKGKGHFEMPPHIYALADETYRAMMNFRENQCIIISGESGAGKTESSKLIMQYISFVSGKGEEVQRVKDRMLSSNPLLETFGNAKTVNNNNSSRFGKYMEIVFDLKGDPVGGRVTNYLLEKSRVVQPAVGERSFHIFYQLTTGATEKEREKYSLYTPDQYSYLSQSECYQVDSINDQKELQDVLEALQIVGVNDAEKDDIYRVVSAVLWLGNMTFKEDNTEKSSIEDGKILGVAANLLGVDAKALEKSIITRQIQTGVGNKAELIVKPATAKQAIFSRDTLSKALFSRLFDWLVFKINQSIKVDDERTVTIGVLDIYGFEIFKFNSFEQLCINFVNERLQQIFIELTLKAEQEEYRNEGIPWNDVKYFNNKPCCDLIENKPGLLSICDDCCHTNKSDQMFVQDLGTYFGNAGNQFIMCGVNDFTVKHYAGDVRYAADGFLTKNKDTLFDDLIEVIQSSKQSFVKNHGWAAIQVSKGQKKRPITVGEQFKQQVVTLMNTLKACTPHYIRCIKPNMTKKPNDFDQDNVKRQVKYLGLLENVNVRRAGYAHRNLFAKFVDRYKLLVPDLAKGKVGGDARAQCAHLFKSVGWTEGQEFAMGKTKAFIRAATSLFQLEDLLERKLNDASITIQKAWKNYKLKRYYIEMRARCYDVVAGKKERRKNSIENNYIGDYLDFSYNNIVRGLLSVVGQQEKVLFSDRARAVVLKGKKSLFDRIKGAFSGQQEDLVEQRFIMLSDQAVYSFTFELDPETKKTRAKLFFRVPINQVLSAVLSPFADNYYILHFHANSGTTDILQSCRRKTEFVGLLANRYKELTNSALNVQFVQKEVINLGKEKSCEIVFVKDETVAKNQDKLVPVKHNVEIHVASGIPPSDVKAPPRPAAAKAKAEVKEAKIEPKVAAKPQLRALYDYKGNEQDELSFKAGDLIDIVRGEENGWYTGNLKGKVGFVPSNYVEIKQHVPEIRKAPPPDQPAKQKQPKGKWVEAYTSSGELYYFNEETGESSWEKPDEKKFVAPPPPPAKSCTFPGCKNNQFPGKDVCVTHMHAKKPKKSAWKAAKDPSSGDTYYYNEETNETTWDKPADLE